MPCAGLVSFLKAPASGKRQPSQGVVMGVPTDFGTGHSTGACFGALDIREASMEYVTHSCYGDAMPDHT